MKTATINIYRIWGTKNSYCADIYYRGKLLHETFGSSPDEANIRSTFWAKNQGFTNVKYIYG